MSIDPKDIQMAADYLRRNHCVAMPTETVYGLAARFDSPVGIRSIFRLKSRPSFDPLIVHVSSHGQISLLTDNWPRTAQALSKEFWPGPLTLVVPKKPSLNSMITSGLMTVGIRMPRHPVALALISEAGPLAAPSANRFGRTSPTSIEHVREEFKSAIASKEIFLLDGGVSEVGIESTVCLASEEEIIILRPGGITIEAIKEFFAREKTEFPNVRVSNVKLHQTEIVEASPGHLEHHYETKKPLIVSWSEPFDSKKDFLVEENLYKAGRVLELKLPIEAALAARSLYGALREADQDPKSDAIFFHRDLTEESQRAGIWRAIDDRLTRAARLKIGTPPDADV